MSVEERLKRIEDFLFEKQEPKIEKGFLYFADFDDNQTFNEDELNDYLPEKYKWNEHRLVNVVVKDSCSSFTNKIRTASKEEWFSKLGLKKRMNGYGQNIYVINEVNQWLSKNK